jgi:hypothetical protein
MAADAMVRILMLGFTRRRWSVLAVATLATLLTHYFCLGTVLGLAAVAMTARRELRRPLLTAFVLAAVVFAVVWAPFMWQQRHLFATDDPNTLFLTAGASNHVALTALRAVLAPVAVCLPYPTGNAIPVAATFGLAVLIVPLIPALRRRSPSLPFWWCWTWGTIGVVAALDFTRGTNHLAFPRYFLLAGPGVYALVIGLARAMGGRHRRLIAGIAIATLASCAIAVPNADVYPFADPRVLVADLPVQPGPEDLLVFAAAPSELVGVESAFLTVNRYLPRPTPRVFAILTRPADEAVLAAARRSRVVFLVTSAADYRAYLPDAHVIRAGRYRGLGNVWTLRYDR